MSQDRLSLVLIVRNAVMAGAPYHHPARTSRKKSPSKFGQSWSADYLFTLEAWEHMLLQHSMQFNQQRPFDIFDLLSMAMPTTLISNSDINHFQDTVGYYHVYYQ
jgi:hypothetical protein